jgi:universal stress protein A
MNMLPFKKILWPTDFSEPSFEALDAAKELALRFSAELTIVHVVSSLPVVPTPPGPTSFNVSLYEEALLDSAKASMEDIIAKRIPDGISVRSAVTTGLVADEIVQEAEKQRIDLIVIATHGETGWRRLVFGSVAEKVVRTAPCPVLVIHAPQKGD